MYYYILICSRGAKISCGKFCKLLWGLAFSLPPGFARRLDYLTFLCGRFWLLAPDFWLLKAQPVGGDSAPSRGTPPVVLGLGKVYGTVHHVKRRAEPRTTGQLLAQNVPRAAV